MVGGRRVGDYIEEWGCADLSDCKAFLISSKQRAQQATKLLATLAKADMDGTHFRKRAEYCFESTVSEKRTH